MLRAVVHSWGRGGDTAEMLTERTEGPGYPIVLTSHFLRNRRKDLNAASDTVTKLREGGAGSGNPE